MRCFSIRKPDRSGRHTARMLSLLCLIVGLFSALLLAACNKCPPEVPNDTETDTHVETAVPTEEPSETESTPKTASEPETEPVTAAPMLSAGSPRSTRNL